MKKASTTAVSWGEYDGPALLAAAATLQLNPANVGTRLRLHRLAATAAALPPHPEARRLSTSALKRALADETVGGSRVRSAEDPFEGMYVAAVPFLGREHLVLQGIATHAATMLQRVLAAIFAGDVSAFPDEYLLRARTLAAFILDISDRTCRSAGLFAGIEPQEFEEVTMPSAARIDAQSHALIHSTYDLFDGIPTTAVDYISGCAITNQGDALEWDDDGLTSGHLMIRPLVRSGDTIVVGAPAELATCIRHWLVTEAHKWGCGRLLAQRLLSNAVNNVRDELSILTDTGLIEIESNATYCELEGTFDSDKKLSVIVLSDDLSNYDESTPFGSWGEFDFLLNGYLPQGEASATSMRLVVTSGIGRDSAIGVPASDPVPTLVAEHSDFEVILGTPGTHRLSLWYFAKALERLNKTSRVMHFSLSDLYSVYRSHDNSFYLSDGAQPTLVNVTPGTGQDLYNSYDRRWGIRYRGDDKNRRLRELRPLHGLDSSPIYEAWDPLEPTCYFEAKGRTAWIRLAGDSSETKSARTLVEAVAYWLWQVIEICMNEDTGSQLTLLVDVSVSSDPGDPFSSGPVVVNEAHGVLNVSFALPDVVDRDGSTPNELDRMLVGGILKAMQLGDQETLDLVVPVGPKAMLHLYSSNRDVLVWPTKSGRATRVDGQVVAELLDELGEHLRTDREHKVGPIASESRTQVLNDHVAEWYKSRLAEEVTELKGDGLVDMLIDHHESLIQESAMEEAILPSRIACYGERSDEVKKIREHQTNSVTAMLASRFLIEYSARVVVSGTEMLTQERYERMLAIGSEIINKGMLSDAIHFGLSDCKVSILPPGRLGLNRDDDPYNRAIGSYSEENATRLAARAVPTSSDTYTSATLGFDEIDALGEAEFGFGYSQLARACVAMAELAQELGEKDVSRWDRADLIGAICKATGYSDDLCNRIVDRLILGVDAGSPDEYWASSGVNPWRFGREESYLRKPLVQMGSGAIVYGVRAVWFAPRAWREQFFSGRLKADSREMRGALANRRVQKGESFEQFVASRLKEIGVDKVRQGVYRIGPVNLKSIDGANLGDVDVLGVDHNHCRVLLLELKNLETARTPAEFEREVKAIFDGPKAAVVRISARANALAERKAEVLSALGITAGLGRWDFARYVVVNEPLMSVWLRRGDVDVLPVARLSEVVG